MPGASQEMQFEDDWSNVRRNDVEDTVFWTEVIAHLKRTEHSITIGSVFFYFGLLFSLVAALSGAGWVVSTSGAAAGVAFGFYFGHVRIVMIDKAFSKIMLRRNQALRARASR